MMTINLKTPKESNKNYHQKKIIHEINIFRNNSLQVRKKRKRKKEDYHLQATLRRNTHFYEQPGVREADMGYT